MSKPDDHLVYGQMGRITIEQSTALTSYFRNVGADRYHCGVCNGEFTFLNRTFYICVSHPPAFCPLCGARRAG